MKARRHSLIVGDRSGRVLMRMADGKIHTATGLAYELDLTGYEVGATLKILRSRGLVERIYHWDRSRWKITEKGMQLAARAKEINTIPTFTYDNMTED